MSGGAIIAIVLATGTALLIGIARALDREDAWERIQDEPYGDWSLVPTVDFSRGE